MNETDIAFISWYQGTPCDDDSTFYTGVKLMQVEKLKSFRKERKQREREKH